MTSIVTSDKKKSFMDVAEQDDALLHNSNMLNLVSAVKSIDAATAHLRDELNRLTALKVEITEFASMDENLQNTTEVQRLYQEVNPRPEKRTRW